MLGRAVTIGVLATGASLLLATGADAATKTVYAGPQIKRPKGLERSEPNAFYPREIEVHAGDKIMFEYLGFHNISYAPPGTKHPILLTADTTIAGLNDGAGAAFWFNGRPRYIFTPTVAFAAGNTIGANGKPMALADGKQFISSGLPLSEPRPKGWTVTYPKTGTFRMQCDVHPGTAMTVHVRAKSAKIPSKAEDKRRADAELRADYKLAAKQKAYKGPAGNVVRVGNDDPAGMSQISFFPKVKRIKVGDTVRFEMTKKTGEEHTVTFGPTDYVTPIEKIGPEAQATGLPKVVLDPRLFHPSDPGLPVYDGANHGNGFLSSGIIDGGDGGLVPRAWSVRFTKAGSFDYLCLLHPYMKGTVVVS